MMAIHDCDFPQARTWAVQRPVSGLDRQSDRIQLLMVIQKKVVLLGAPPSAKTSLVRRFACYRPAANFVFAPATMTPYFAWASAHSVCISEMRASFSSDDVMAPCS